MVHWRARELQSGLRSSGTRPPRPAQAACDCDVNSFVFPLANRDGAEIKSLVMPLAGSCQWDIESDPKDPTKIEPINSVSRPRARRMGGAEGSAVKSVGALVLLPDRKPELRTVTRIARRKPKRAKSQTTIR